MAKSPAKARRPAAGSLPTTKAESLAVATAGTILVKITTSQDYVLRIQEPGDADPFWLLWAGDPASGMAGAQDIETQYERQLALRKAVLGMVVDVVEGVPDDQKADWLANPPPRVIVNLTARLPVLLARMGTLEVLDEAVKNDSRRS
ncbi:unnamed protein product [marine sediment metagenome]|uniref:Uncharacterized protein n=1 Tax=marine sediment metagenome TaxID=412755 RepID=X0T0S3_9ZZZZ